MDKEKQKQATYEWRKKNPERAKEIQKKASRKYAESHRQKMSAIQSKYYYKNREEILRKAKERRERMKGEK